MGEVCIGAAAPAEKLLLPWHEIIWEGKTLSWGEQQLREMQLNKIHAAQESTMEINIKSNKNGLVQ